MEPLLIILIVIAALFVIACSVAYIQHWLHPDGYEASPQEIRAQLQKIVDGNDRYALDDLISVPLKDRRLEAIRKRCADLPEEFPPESKEQFCGPKGLDVIRGFIRELENQSG